MKQINRLLAVCYLVLLSGAVLAASTIDRTVPPDGTPGNKSPLNSYDMRQQFGRAADDIEDLQARTTILETAVDDLSPLALKSVIDLATDVEGALAVEHGGTSGTTAAAARANLGIGSLGTKSAADLGSSDVSGVLPVLRGGNGSATPGIIAGSNCSVSGFWPNQVISCTGGGGGSGVTSVNLSGAATGLTFSGGPITGSGTITLGGTLGVGYGGTGANTAADARTNLGLGALATKSAADLNSSDVSAVLPIAKGGTGTDTPAGVIAGPNCTVTGTFPAQTISCSGGGGGTVSSVALSGGSTGLTVTGSPITGSGTITLAGTLAVGSGGTGATTAGGARAALGATAVGDAVFTAGDAAAARTGIGLGALAVKSVADLAGDTSGTLPLAKGGTNATNATQALANLMRDSTMHAKWSAALQGQKSGAAATTIAMIGDSLIDSVSGGTRLTSISNMMRNGLTHSGLPVNDNAWIGCGDDGNSGARRDISDVRITKGSSWACDNTFLTMGGGTWYATTNTNALVFTPDMYVTGATVLYVIQPGGGSFTFDNNGVGTQTINTSGTAALGTFTYSGGQGANTVYNIRWSSGGRVDIVGVIATNSSGSMVTLINAGVGGSVSAAAVNNTNPWSYLNVLTALAPGLTIFDYAANDATLAVPTSTYQTNLQTLLTAIDAWGGDAIAMTPPPKNPAFVGSGGTQSYVYQETYNNILRTQAATFNVPVADVFNMYEGNYTKFQALGLYTDTFVHQSAKGNGTIADLLSRIVMSRFSGAKQQKTSVFQELESWSNYKLGAAVIIPKNMMNGNNAYFGVSGNSASTATQNAAFGAQAGNALTTGFNHTAFGFQALLSMTTGQNNAAFGYQSLRLSTGNDNSGFGTLACGSVTTGTNNLCLGRGVGSTTLTTGANNILIGTSSAVTTPAAATANYLNIGNAINGNLVTGGALRFSGETVAANDNASTTTTLANITGLTATLEAAKTYRFEAELYFDADATGGHKYAIAGTATATAIKYQVTTICNATNDLVISSRQTAMAGSVGQAGCVAGYTKINGTIISNAAGTLTVQFAQNAAGGTSSVLRGSNFVVREVQ